ncbi:hypothetical protein T484DRAFT_1970057, partial [Baffinella frigidus]
MGTQAREKGLYARRRNGGRSLSRSSTTGTRTSRPEMRGTGWAGRFTTPCSSRGSGAQCPPATFPSLLGRAAAPSSSTARGAPAATREVRRSGCTRCSPARGARTASAGWRCGGSCASRRAVRTGEGKLPRTGAPRTSLVVSDSRSEVGMSRVGMWSSGCGGGGWRGGCSGRCEAAASGTSWTEPHSWPFSWTSAPSPAPRPPQ